GISRVSGDLVLNASFFDAVGRHPDWPAGQENKWYQAPSSALAFNDNVVYVSIGPGGGPGRPAASRIEPDNDLFRAVSLARTIGQRGRVAVGVKREAGSGDIEVYGSVPNRPVNWTTPIAIDDPPAFFGSALRKRLAAAGIQVLGALILKDVKPDA